MEPKKPLRRRTVIDTACKQSHVRETKLERSLRLAKRRAGQLSRRPGENVGRNKTPVISFDAFGNKTERQPKNKGTKGRGGLDKIELRAKVKAYRDAVAAYKKRYHDWRADRFELK